MSASYNPLAVAVGVNGSASALAAVRWAAGVAERDAVPVRLVHAYQPPRGHVAGTAAREAMVNEARVRGRRWIAQALDVVTGSHPGVPIEVVLQPGPAARLLLTESRAASVVVLGTRGLGALTGLLSRSTTVGVAGQADCPVVVVRATTPDVAPRESGPVVVGVDTTYVIDSALDFAFAEATARGTELVAVHAWVESLLDPADGDQIGRPDLEDHRRRALAALSECLAGWQGTCPGVRVRHEVVHDRPGRALCGFSRGAQLVVVTRRRHDAFRGLLLGSTSQYLLDHALCPIAVIRDD